jgi:ribonuclease H / adenosylcobalamin/alpha-ribazole phosphatase
MPAPNSRRTWRHPPQGQVGSSFEATTATAVNRRAPSATPRWTAVRSAHTDSGYEAFSTFTPVKTLLRLALGAPPEALFRMELSAASLSAVAYHQDGNVSVRLFNDTGHLR